MEADSSLLSKDDTAQASRFSYLASCPELGSVQQPDDAFGGQILAYPVQQRPWYLVRLPCLQVVLLRVGKCCLSSFTEYAAGGEYIWESASHGRNKAIVHRRHIVK